MKPVATFLRNPLGVSSSSSVGTFTRRAFATSHSTNCGCCGTLPFLCTNVRSRANHTFHAPSPSSKQHRMSFTTDTTLTDDNIENANHHIRSMLRNNRKWAEARNQEDPNYFPNLVKSRKPKFLYFGCSDSCVPANEIFGLGPGDVFVHRNIGNLVPGNDLNVLSVLEYVVGHLGVTDIIVNGHYSCRAVKAATSRQDLGTLENWLRLIRDVYRLHKDYLDLIKDPEQLHRTLVELNVIEQCLNVYKTGVVQRKRAQTRKELQDTGKSKQEVQDGIFPRIHGMVFNPEGGNLRVLPINFDKRVGSLDHIYGLYEKPSY